MGCANIAQRLIIPNIRKSSRFEVVAVASRNLQKARAFANQFNCVALEGYQALLNMQEIDTVYMPLPTSLHYEWITKALEAKKHILCEKSFAMNFPEAKEIIEMATRQKLVVFENFMFPYHLQIEFVKSKINSGEIGQLRLFRSTFGFPPFEIDNNIRYKKILGGGALLDAGAYTLMAAQLFMGSEQKIESAILNNLGNEVDFQGAIQLVNENQLVSQLAFGFDNFYQNTIELWGTGGKITMERAFTAGSGYCPKIVIEKQGVKDEVSLPEDNQCFKILEDFADAIEKGEYDAKYNQILNQAYLINQINDYAKK